LARALAEQREEMEGETPRGDDDYVEEADDDVEANGSQVNQRPKSGHVA